MLVKVLSIFLGLVLVSSCVFRPNYTRPEVDVPDSWRLPTKELCCHANIRWWEELGDPVLDAMVIEALENNNDLQVAIANVDAYYAAFRMVYSNLFPQINATGSAIRQELSSNSNFGLPENLRLTNLFTLLLNFSYEIDIWGRLYSASDAALATYLAQVQARRAVVLTIVSAVANSYFTLRQYDEQLQVSRESLKSFEESLEIMTARFQGGAISQLPVEQARSERDAAAIQVKQFEVNVAQEENLLSILLGRNPGDVVRGKMLNELTQPPCVPAGLPSSILDQRPDVMEAEMNLASAHSNVGYAKASLFPNIALTGFYGNESFQLRNLFTGASRAWQFGGVFAQPIFNGGFYLAQIDYANAQEREALYTYYSVILNAFKEVDDALIAHTKSLELLQVQKDQVQALQLYQDLAQLEYDNGQVDYLNVLDAQRNLFSAQLNLVAAQNNTYTTLINLYKALGGGWVIEADTIAIEGQDCIEQ